jgi:hypothetical protein
MEGGGLCDLEKGCKVDWKQAPYFAVACLEFAGKIISSTSSLYLRKQRKSQASIKQRSKMTLKRLAHRTCANTTPAPQSIAHRNTHQRLLSSHKLQHSPTSGVPAQRP